MVVGRSFLSRSRYRDAAPLGQPVHHACSRTSTRTRRKSRHSAAPSPARGRSGLEDQNSQYVSVCSFTSNAAFDGVLSARRRVTVSWQLCCQVKCLALRGDFIFLRVVLTAVTGSPLRLHWRTDHWQGRPWTAAAGDQAATECHQLGCLCHCGMLLAQRNAAGNTALSLIMPNYQFAFMAAVCCPACWLSFSSVGSRNATSHRYALLLRGHLRVIMCVWRSCCHTTSLLLLAACIGHQGMSVSVQAFNIVTALNPSQPHLRRGQPEGCEEEAPRPHPEGDGPCLPAPGVPGHPAAASVFTKKNELFVGRVAMLVCIFPFLISWNDGHL